MTTAGASALERLAAEHPEWRVWTASLAATLRETGRAEWERHVPSPAAARPADGPLLAGTVVEVDRGLVGRWVGELLSTAATVGAPVAPTAPAGLDALDLLEAAIADDRLRLEATAASLGQEPAALAALAPLVAMPLLQACHRRLAGAVPATWSRGYCPVCGAWPALAEARGLERARCLRCGRCGADWPILWLRCPFCGEAHHERLATLVTKTYGDTRKIDGCLTCRGYVKTRTTLQPSSGPEVVLEDLATVDLDVAALEQGYRRPEPPGCPLGLRVTAPRRGRAC